MDDLVELRSHANAFFDYMTRVLWNQEKAKWPFDEDGRLLPRSKR